MTKDELKKEAEEWVKDHSGLIGSYEYVKYDYDSLIQAYLASAEPREKQIQEKDKKIAELKEINTHTLSQLNLDNGELITQLTKAKNILKYVLYSFVGDLPKELGFFDEEELKAIAEAEQFLSEVGK